MDSSTSPQTAYAAALPAVIIVIWPAAALAAPPEIGASRYSTSCSARRDSSAMDQLGSTVEHITNTAPARKCGAMPPSPYSTDSVCWALTTTLMTMSQAAPMSASVAQATPP